MANEQQNCRYRRPELPERPVHDPSQCVVGVEYAGKLEAVVFRFEDGKILGVSLRELEGVDDTPLTRVSLAYEGDIVVIEQFSGNRLEVPASRLRRRAPLGIVGLDDRDRQRYPA